jgi:hypothetical protein
MKIEQNKPSRVLKTLIVDLSLGQPVGQGAASWDCYGVIRLKLHILRGVSAF